MGSTYHKPAFRTLRWEGNREGDGGWGGMCAIERAYLVIIFFKCNRFIETVLKTEKIRTM